MTMGTLIYILIFIIVALIGVSVAQIKMSGIKVEDFWGFVEANQKLDKLYAISKKCDKLSPQEQIIYLQEAEELFKAYEKVPSTLWEEEYSKYIDVLNTYKDIRMTRWAMNS